MNKLAINGGSKVRKKLFPSQMSIFGDEYYKNINRRMEDLLGKGIYSGYRGNASDAFNGGYNIRKVEQEFSDYFGAHAIAVNSCTSGLIIACGAIGLENNDEVLVTPWSMTCSATAPLFYGAVPKFADIEREHFCIDPSSIRNYKEGYKKIDTMSKAIIAVDLFGQTYDVEKLERLARKYNLAIIEDAAQAIGSKYKNRHAGTIGDIGVFSFTQGKHLTCGEGGMILTNDPELNHRCRLIRNHAEAVLNDTNFYFEHKNMVGFNNRMTEFQAIILSEQLKYLNKIVEMRLNNVLVLFELLKDLDIIEFYPIRDNCTHSYYVLPLKYTGQEELPLDKYVKAVKAELAHEENRIDRGIMVGQGYIKPIYQMPLFQKKQHWALRNKSYEYYRGWNCEKLQNELIITLLHGLPLKDKDLQDVANAFIKVWENREEIQ
ncbi:MAG: DegT/DnrJ/EryC1/StrS family aminotransferase [Promethearchaeota archaeon]|jgi:dTDP-4-amino-4,6-dideoxygalactose transaminase